MQLSTASPPSIRAQIDFHMDQQHREPQQQHRQPQPQQAKRVATGDVANPRDKDVRDDAVQPPAMMPRQAAGTPATSPYPLTPAAQSMPTTPMGTGGVGSRVMLKAHASGVTPLRKAATVDGSESASSAASGTHAASSHASTAAATITADLPDFQLAIDTSALTDHKPDTQRKIHIARDRAVPPLWSPTAGTLLDFNQASMSFVVVFSPSPKSPAAQSPTVSPLKKRNASASHLGLVHGGDAHNNDAMDTDEQRLESPMSPRHLPLDQPVFSFPLPSPYAQEKPRVQHLNEHFEEYSRRKSDVARETMAAAAAATQLNAGVADSSTAAAASEPPAFVRTKLPRTPSQQELDAFRHAEAAKRRETLLQLKTVKLQRWIEHVRQRALLQKQKDRLHHLRLKAKVEFSQRAANLKRQLVLQREVRRTAAHVDRAQTIGLLKRLERCMELQRSYSTSFAEMLGGLPAAETRDLFSTDPEGPVHRRRVALQQSSASLNDGRNAERAHAQAVLAQGMDALELDDADRAVLAAENEEQNNATTTATTLNPLFGPAESIGSSGLTRTTSITFPIQREDRETADLQCTSLEYVFGVDNLPPVTRRTLQELSLESILGSVQLRHDMLFDPNLEFRVNDQGERAVAKEMKLNKFWSGIEADLDGSQHADGKPVFGRIPVLLHEIKSILLELAANDQYKHDIEQHMDIPLLAQHLAHGVFNGEGLIEFIASIIKAHCAPARDGLVDDMVATAKQGNMARTLRQCFDILERMKLDVANDLLKRMRPAIIEGAVEFEWENFKGRLQRGDIKLGATAEWLSQCRRKFDERNAAVASPALKQPITDLFFSAFLDLIVDVGAGRNSFGGVPETLQMDRSRLVGFYNDWQDVTIMTSLLTLLRQFCGANARPSTEQVQELKKNMWVLLADEDTSLAHISLYLCDQCAKIRRRELSEQEKTMFTSIIDKTLSPDNKVYQLIQQRIQDQLMEVVKRRQLKEREVLIQQGLVEVEQEILELGERIRALVNHNKAVYAKVYNQIVDMQNAAAAATLSMAASSTAPVAPQNGDGSASTQ